MTLSFPFPQSWITTFGGLLAGVPVLIMNSGLVLSSQSTHILSIIGGLGTLIIGLAAKQYNVHSTQTEINTSTVVANAKAVAALPKG